MSVCSNCEAFQDFLQCIFSLDDVVWREEHWAISSYDKYVRNRAIDRPRSPTPRLLSLCMRMRSRRLGRPCGRLHVQACGCLSRQTFLGGESTAGGPLIIFNTAVPARLKTKSWLRKKLWGLKQGPPRSDAGWGDFRFRLHLWPRLTKSPSGLSGGETKTSTSLLHLFSCLPSSRSSFTIFFLCLSSVSLTRAQMCIWMLVYILFVKRTHENLLPVPLVRKSKYWSEKMIPNKFQTINSTIFQAYYTLCVQKEISRVQISSFNYLFVYRLLKCAWLPCVSLRNSWVEESQKGKLHHLWLLLHTNVVHQIQLFPHN